MLQLKTPRYITRLLYSIVYTDVEPPSSFLLLYTRLFLPPPATGIALILNPNDIINESSNT